MADMTDRQIQFWLSEIESSEKRKDAELKKRNNYPQLISYYEGLPEATEQVDLKTGIKTKMAMQNEYYPNINILIYEILYQNPDIITKPTKPVSDGRLDPLTGLPMQIDNEANAPTLKTALTFAWDKLEGLDENRLGLFDMLTAGFCAIEVNIVNRNPAPIPENPGMLERIKTKLTQGTIAEQSAKEEPTSEEIYSNDMETYIRRWNPLNIGFDYRAERIKDIKYIYKIIKKTYAEAIAEYPELDGKVSAEESIPYSSHAQDQYNKTLTFYEVQRKKKGGVFETFLICKGYKYRELYRFTRTYTTNGFNIKIGVLDDYGRLYPISKGQINKSTQDDINNYLTHKMEVAERNVPKRAYDKNKVDDTTAVPALSNKLVNNLVPVNGPPANAIEAIPMSQVSPDNNELLMAFERHKEKLWGVSGQRLQVGTKPEFAEELKMQESGFQSMQAGSQEGLRKVIKQQLNTLKDIIVQMWDEPMWFKITGSPQPTWYGPEIGALPDVLSLDYEVEVDMVSSLMPNKEKQKKDMIEYLTWLIKICLPAVLMPQGFTISVDEIKKSAKEYGFSPDNLIIQMPMPTLPPGGVTPGGVLPPQGGVV